jgi:hypothetical protein
MRREKRATVNTMTWRDTTAPRSSPRPPFISLSLPRRAQKNQRILEFAIMIVVRHFLRGAEGGTMAAENAPCRRGTRRNRLHRIRP